MQGLVLFLLLNFRAIPHIDFILDFFVVLLAQLRSFIARMVVQVRIDTASSRLLRRCLFLFAIRWLLVRGGQLINHIARIFIHDTTVTHLALVRDASPVI